MGSYSLLLGMLDHAVEEQFLKQENRALVRARDQPADLLRALEQWHPAHIEKWLSRENR
jgi:predicted Rossmann-fold nucleotide-binding protein